tara:strand:+ start:618 stop:857 length:240 start_codon:yes stop_codon:yes gene_type:complete
MMNDMMPTIEETITPDIAAQIEHEEWLRILHKWSEERERAEAWDCISQNHNNGFPLMDEREWREYQREYSDYLDSSWKD